MSATITRDLVLSETEVRAVLERAVLIESKNGALSVQELERIASEAGISTGAMHVALREVLEARNMPSPAQAVAQPAISVSGSPPRSQAFRLVLCAITGISAGMLAAAGDGEAMLGAGLLLAGALLRAFRHRRSDTPGEYQAELLAAWTSFSIGFGMADGNVPEDLMFAVGFMYTWSATIGGIISASKRFTWRPWKRSIRVEDPRDTRS